MGHMTYEASKKLALKLIILLAIVTMVEVFISLLGKGHIIEGLKFNTGLIAIIMVIFSVVKAYFIVGEFMHLKHETGGMGKTVIIPFVLLIWGVIAFLGDGSSWLKNKDEMATLSSKYESHKTVTYDGKDHDTHTKTHDAEAHDEHKKAKHGH